MSGNIQEENPSNEAYVFNDGSSVHGAADSDAGDSNRSYQFAITPKAQVSKLAPAYETTEYLLDHPQDGGHSGHSRKNSRAGRRLSTWAEELGRIHGEGTSPIYCAIFNMLAGCGTVGLPVTYKDSGVIVGIILMVLVAMFCLIIYLYILECIYIKIY